MKPARGLLAFGNIGIIIAIIAITRAAYCLADKVGSNFYSSVESGCLVCLPSTLLWQQKQAIFFLFAHKIPDWHFFGNLFGAQMHRGLIWHFLKLFENK